MNEEDFWNIIAASLEHTQAGTEEQYNWIRQKLTTLTVEEIIEFENQLNQLKIKTCTFPLLIANFIIQSYVSDDVFEDFRLWLIANGKDHFYAALENPDNIAEFCHVDDPIEDIQGQGLYFVAKEVYQEKTQRDDFIEQTKLLHEPEIEMNWPESSKAFQMLMPRLYKAYWSPGRIKAFHRPNQSFI
jgi:hypothetical protein